MPARSVCLVTLSLSEAGPGVPGASAARYPLQTSTIPYHTCTTSVHFSSLQFSSVQFTYHTIPRCSSVRLQNTRLLSIWTGANEAVGNMKLFNNHSGLRGLLCFAEGIYWATGLSLTTPFTEGCPGVDNKASPPGRHQEQAPKQRCTFSSTTFSSVQFRPRTRQYYFTRPNEV